MKKMIVYTVIAAVVIAYLSYVWFIRSGKTQGSVPSPEYRLELMGNICWSFTGGAYDSVEEFRAAAEEYNRRFGHGEVDLQQTVLPGKEIKVICSFRENAGAEETEEELLLVSTGERFTALELLYLIHNRVAERFGKEDRNLFEGLTLTDPGTDIGIPVYMLDQGSRTKRLRGGDSSSNSPTDR